MPDKVKLLRTESGFQGELDGEEIVGKVGITQDGHLAIAFKERFAKSLSESDVELICSGVRDFLLTAKGILQ